MKKERRVGPVEGLRNLALALERLVAREVASSAVRGAAEGLREELPEVDEQLRALLADAYTILGRLLHEAAEREHLEPGAAAHAMAAAATQGVLEVLERGWQDGGLPLHGLAKRLNCLLDEVVELAHSRADEIRTPAERAQALSRGMIKAAVEQLRESMPALVEDARKWAPQGAEIARKAGRGFVEGLESKLRDDAGALERPLESAGRGLGRGLVMGMREALASSRESLVERSSAAAVRGAVSALEERLRPLLAVVGAGGALLALSWLVTRRRTA